MRRRSGSLWWAWVMVAGACGGGSPEHGVSSTGGGGGTPAQGGSTGAAGMGGTAGTGGAGAGGMAARRPWPDSTAKTLILADQLPDGLTAAQQQFVVGHLVGTQKLTLAQSQPLRALAPNFLVLHYHLAIWQSAPAVTFIVDGMSWGNDYPTVTMNESWFWHNQSGQRVAATDDGKLLMNVGDAGFAAYWKSSILAQIAAGDDDGLFADSASPDLLQWEAQSPPEPRLAGTGARDTAIAELGGETYVEAWQAFMTDFNAALAATGVPLIPNTGSFTTSWDTTDYSLTAGVFVEGFADPTFAPADWQRSMNQILALVGKHKIVIVQNYLDDPTEVATRLYYLANYLLVRGDRSYLDYFAGGPLEWYPEWEVDLGAPVATAATVGDLATGGAYEREFANGWAVVNPTASAATLTFPASARLVTPQGGGAIDAAGDEPGSITYGSAASLTLEPSTAAIILK